MAAYITLGGIAERIRPLTGRRDGWLVQNGTWRGVIPDRFVGSIFPVPMAQEALAHFAFADKKDFASLVTEATDAWRIRSFEFDPRLAPGVVVAFDSRHSKPFITRGKTVRVLRRRCTEADYVFSHTKQSNRIFPLTPLPPS